MNEISFIRPYAKGSIRGVAYERGLKDARELKKLMRDIINHPLITVGIEDDENADLFELVQKARVICGNDRLAGEAEK